MGFLDLLGPFWLCLAAPVWAVSRPMLGSGRPGVLGSFRSPWGGTAAAGGGACAGAGRRALGYFCWCHFLVRTLERLSERLCRCGCRGARAARRGAAYPFGAGGRAVRPRAPPQRADQKSADSNDHIDVVLTNTLERRAAYPSTCAVGEHRVRARPDGGAACPVGAGGRAVRARGAATVRSGAVWRCFCSQHFFGRNAGAALRAPAVPWQVQERVRGLAGGLPTRPEPVAEPSGLERRHSAPACVERSTSWWRTARVSWEFCGSSVACTPVLTVSGGGQECGAAPRAAGSPRAVCPGRGERPLRVA